MTAKSGLRQRTPNRAIRAAAIALLATALTGPLLTATAAPTSTQPTATIGSPSTTRPTAAQPTKTPQKQAVEPVRKDAANTSLACGGALDWFAVSTCEQIAAGETDTYTATTTKAGEVILGRVNTADGMSIDVTLTGADTSCHIAAGFEPEECRTGAPGTYTLTVVGRGEPGPYTVSLGSTVAPGCLELTAADLSPSAAGHAGVLASGKVADCYEFPGAPGDVVRVGQGGGTVTIYDAAGTQVCRVVSTPFTCEPKGPGPLRAFVIQGADAAGSYKLRTTRLNDPIGCADLPLAPFGAPGEAVGTGPLQPWQTDCRIITATDGLYDFRVAPTNNAVSVSLDVFDSTGHEACREQTRGACLLAAGSYMLLLENRNYDDQLTYQVAAFALADNRGCATEVGTSWDLPILEKTRTSLLQVDCQPIRAVAGERLLVRSPGRVWGDTATTRVVDKDGGLACPRVIGVIGCVLEGTGPYRVLSGLGQVAAPNAYQLDIGRLSNPVGCTPVGFSKFGVAPTAPAGSRCRQITVATPGTYVIDAGGNQDWNDQYGLYGTDGLVGCSAMLRCALTKSGSYALVAPPDVPVAAFALTATDGCVAQGADTFAVRSGSLTDKQYDCLTLSSPVGANVAVVEPANQAKIEGTVVDAVGHESCRSEYQGIAPCKLTGTPPFRVLVHPVEIGPYKLSVPRVDGTGCQVLPPSDFTTPGGVTASLSPDRIAACYTVPAGSHSATELIQFARTGAVGIATLMIVNSAGDEACHVDTNTGAFNICGYAPAESYSAVLVGDATTAGYRVMRRDVTSTAKGCAAITSSTIGATAGSGTLADNSVLRCHRINAAATDRFMINTRDARGSVRATAFGPAGQAVCQTVREARCDASGYASYQVVVWNDPTMGAAGPYTIETPRILAAGVPAPECARVSSAYGVGPFTGELTTAKNTTCTVFPLGRYETTRGVAANQVAGGPTPDVVTSWGGFPLCRGSGDGFECNNLGDKTQNQMLLLSLPEQPTSSLKYKLSTTCEQPLCGGAVFGVTSAAPKTGVVGTTVNVTLKGTALHSRDVVRLTVAGKSAITGTVRSVSGDRTSSVYAFNLAGAALGVRDVSVKSYAGATVTLAKAFTVLGAAPKVTKSPVLSGTAQVNHTVGVSVGSWSPACLSYGYQWYSGGVAVAGATRSTLLLTAARAPWSLYAAVTCARTGYVSGRAVSNTVRVRA